MSVANTINIAKVCIPLAVRDIAKQLEQDRDYPRKLYIAYQTLDDLNTYDPTNTDVTLLNDYTFALCGGYYFEAANILALSTGGSIANPSTGAVVTLGSIDTQFVVNASTSPIIDGATTLLINIPSTASLQNLQIALDGIVLPVGVADRISYSMSYSAGVITIIFNQAAITGQLILVTGTYFV